MNTELDPALIEALTTPPPVMQAQLTPELESEFDALKMELRGYEVAKETDSGWEKVGTYRPTEHGLAAAKRSAAWLTWRTKERKAPQNYRVRPLVSIDIDFTRKTADLDDALVQDFGDIIPAEPFDHDAAKEEALKAFDAAEAQRMQDEMDLAIANARDNAAGGYVVSKEAAGPVVPFNYAQAAADMPFEFGG